MTLNLMLTSNMVYDNDNVVLTNIYFSHNKYNIDD